MAAPSYWKSDIMLTGAEPVLFDVQRAGWVRNDRGVGIGTDGSIWFIKYDGTNIKSVELA